MGAMTERGMIFSAAMVRALLDGRKTQTRRPVKVPEKSQKMRSMRGGVWLPNAVGEDVWINSPYGVPGDRIWVRETGWQRPPRTPKMMREGADTWERYYYDADGLDEVDHKEFKAWGFKRRPAIHMPRWASRITLEITEVRVERVQEISEADALAEGIKHSHRAITAAHAVPCFWDYLRNEPQYTDPRSSYSSLWEFIYGPGSWDADPWVWVYSFKRID